MFSLMYDFEIFLTVRDYFFFILGVPSARSDESEPGKPEGRIGASARAIAQQGGWLFNIPLIFSF